MVCFVTVKKHGGFSHCAVELLQMDLSRHHTQVMHMYSNIFLLDICDSEFRELNTLCIYVFTLKLCLELA